MNGSVVDLALNSVGGLAEVTSACTDILADTLDGIAGGEGYAAGGYDCDNKKGEEVFHRA